MKRYSPVIEWNPDADAKMEEYPRGDYYLVADVEREMIPRPDAEEARKAVDEYTTAVIDDVMSCECIGPCSQVRRLKAALLRLMGVGEE